MTANERAGVTPAGIRDGRPDVLQALVAARGSAVLAYCRAVCTPDDAPRAAAEAFARFRAAVVDAPDVAAIDPDALLLGATRHAAASLARTTRATGRADREQDTCAEVPGLLAARAAGVLGDEEGARLDSHLERCPGCRSLAADFVEAEEAYRTATSVPVPPPAERMILVALEAAAPVVDTPEEEPPPLEPEPEPEPDVEDDEDLAADDDQPTFEDDELDESGLFPDELPDHEDEDDEHDHPPREPRPPLRERLPRPARPSLTRPRLRRERPAAEPVAQPIATGQAREERRDLRPLVLPALVVLAALVVTLAAAGVFGGDEPEPPQAERQRPELRVEEPVTTPLPVEPAPPPAQTAPAVTEPAPGATTTTPATTTPAATTPQGTTPTTTATVPAPAP